MSAAGILSSSFLNSLSQNTQSSSSTATSSAAERAKFREELAQLGQDIFSGTTSAAQSDLTTLQQTTTSVSSDANKAMSKLSADLRSGNLSAAHQDYATLRSDLKYDSSSSSSSSSSTSGQSSAQATSASASTNALMLQLSQALQAGNFSAAQLAYSNLGTQMFSS